MKILYDHQIFTTQKYGGISRYFYELIKAFETMEDVQTDIPLLISNNYYISDKNYVKHMNFFKNKEFRGKHRLMLMLNKPNMISELKKQDFDVLHITYYNSYFLKYLGNKPFVLTVYDMIHEKFQNMFPSNDKTSLYKKILIEKASKIIAISQSTKNDLIEFFDVDPSKIEVIYLANSMVLTETIKLTATIPKNYLLFVGSRAGYKNFDRFIYSSEKLLKENYDLSIVCAGGGQFNEYEISLFNKLNIRDKVYQYNLDDELLAHFYKNASLFIFPSLYEGFGIPVLEAFACECPLVCSNTSSLPEIAADAAEYFDPYSEASMHNAMNNVLNDSIYRQKLVDNGNKRLKLFSWEQTAIYTKKVYESVIK